VRERGCDREVRHIACPFKNTAQSIAATRQAKRLAELFGAKLHLLRVIDGSDVAPEIAALAGDDVTIEDVRLDADPGPQILRLARDMDLIVLPAKHRRFSDPSEVGTPSSHIVRTSECPVLTVTAG
jgi:nucleotide-binding universal stress UspA family protein